MLKQIYLSGFKCFDSEVRLTLPRLTVFYGKNGSGKSTTLQALLLLSQTIKDSDDLNSLTFNGSMLNLESFHDVVNRYSEGNTFQIGYLTTEGKEFRVTYGPYANKPKLAKLLHVIADDREYNSMSSSSTIGDIYTAHSSDVKQLSIEQTISGISAMGGYDVLKKVYYVSAERQGPTNFVRCNDNLPNDYIGIHGENLINVLANVCDELKAEINVCLSQILCGASLDTKKHDNIDIIELLLDSREGSQGFRPTNVGFGYSYVLPIVLSALLVPTGSVLVIENPEAHLFTGSQSRVIQFLINQATKRNLQVLLETHSDHIVNGLRIAVKQNQITRHDAIIHYFERDEYNCCKSPLITTIQMDEQGELSTYPDDFMDEWTKQMIKLV